MNPWLLFLNVPSKKWYTPINFNNIVFVIAKDNNMMQPHKTIFIKTPYIWKMYKGIRKRKGENSQDMELIQTKCQNFSMSKIDRL